MKSTDRVLVYGMQSSGASLFTYFLAQIPDSIGIIDLWSDEVVPVIDTKFPVILKITASNLTNFQENVDVFRPNFIIFFVRDPVNTYLSLDKKPNRDEGGTLENQLKMIESMYVKKDYYFDATIYYENFTLNPFNTIKELNLIGLTVPEDAWKFNRSPDDILEYNSKHYPWCQENYMAKWSFGNLRKNELKELRPISYGPASKDIVTKVDKLCPTIMEYYRRKGKRTISNNTQ